MKDIADRWRARRGGACVAAAAALILLLIPGCYLAQLGAGQLRIAVGQRTLDDILADPNLSPARRQALCLITDIHRYGATVLGLAGSDSYTTYYDTGGGPVMYNVTAARADRLEPVTWWFPVVGTVGYKGFFSIEDARRERDYLARLGYDVHLSRVAAYSTLGWFRDPILSTMLDDPPEALAELVLHEMAHTTVYVAGDTDFNEQFASYVGEAGAEAYWVSREGPDGPTVRAQRARRADARRFAAWVRETRDALEAYYAGPGTPAEKRRGRLAVFAAALDRFRAIAPRFETAAYAGVPHQPLNNARILAWGRYHDLEENFERVAEALGGDVRAFLDVGRTLAASGDARAALGRWLRARGTAAARPASSPGDAPRTAPSLRQDRP